MNIAIFASGEGSTLQAVLDACRKAEISARVCLVISNNSKSGALAKAAAAGVASRHFSALTHPDPATLDSELKRCVTELAADVVLLAGFMKKLGPATLAAFRGRILNTHPALLPKFGGRGMYGLAVHQAVLDAKESVTGASVHLVEAEYDTGKVIAQRELTVEADDTAESLCARVQVCERLLLIAVLKELASGVRSLPLS